MIERDEVYTDEKLFHAPPEKPQKPRKANHKHIYVPAVFERPTERLDGSRGSVDDTELTIGTYCEKCGKINGYTYRPYLNVQHIGMRWISEWTGEAKKELDPNTRTLPFFKLSDRWAKTVEDSL